MLLSETVQIYLYIHRTKRDQRFGLKEEPVYWYRPAFSQQATSACVQYMFM